MYGENTSSILKDMHNTSDGKVLTPTHESESYSMRFQRETLFVSGPPATQISTHAEGTVPYNSKPDETHALQTRKSQCTDCFTVGDISVSKEDDAFSVALVIVSRFLTGTLRKGIIRISCHLFPGGDMQTAISGVFVASNVAKVSVVPLKKSEGSSEVTMFVYQDPSPSATYQELVIPNIDSPACTGNLTAELFRKVFDERTAVLLMLRSDSAILSVMRATSVLCAEALASDSDLVGLNLQPSSESGSVRAVISRTDPAITNIVEQALSHVPSPLENRSVIGIEVNTTTFGLVEVANSVIRSFMAGYPSVELVPRNANLEKLMGLQGLAELILITVKYFSLTLQPGSDQALQLMRKSSTVDPFAKPESAGDFEEIAESESMGTVVTMILARMGKGEKAVFTIIKSVSLVREILSVASRLGSFSISIFPAGPKRVQMSVGLVKLTLDISNILASYKPSDGGDVSPSNFKAVDSTVRFGSDEEFQNYTSGLESLVPGYEARFSVLLVGPRNIGYGVRLLTEGIPEKQTAFEFVSERAVRDQQGTALKCAVRLFIKRESESIALPSFDDLIGKSALVEVDEADSRITIANRLFTALNEASNANPYVLIKAQGDHCVFIAVMSVVVANGWSRTIHQRVETRVAGADRDVVYFITRLIVNTEYFDLLVLYVTLDI